MLISDSEGATTWFLTMSSNSTEPLLWLFWYSNLPIISIFLRFGSVGFTQEFRAALILPSLDDYAPPSWLIAFRFMREFPYLFSNFLFLRFGSSIKGVWIPWRLSVFVLMFSCEPSFELFRMLSRTTPVFRLWDKRPLAIEYRGVLPSGLSGGKEIPDPIPSILYWVPPLWLRRFIDPFADAVSFGPKSWFLEDGTLKRF